MDKVSQIIVSIELMLGLLKQELNQTPQIKSEMVTATAVTPEVFKPKRHYQRRVVEANEPEAHRRKSKYTAAERSELMRQNWARRRAKGTATKIRKNNSDDGSSLENCPMGCSTCAEEFTYSGFLLDAICPSCGSSSVYKV